AVRVACAGGGAPVGVACRSMGRQEDTASSFGAQILARFAAKAPLAMAVRLAMEHALSAAEIDALFERERRQQYTRKIAFSLIVDVMGAVVTGKVDAVHAAV